MFKGADHSFICASSDWKQLEDVQKEVYRAFVADSKFVHCIFANLCMIWKQSRKAKLLPIVFRIANQRVKEALVNFEGLSQKRGRQNQQKISTPLSLMKIYPMTSLSVRSIWMGSTFYLESAVEERVVLSSWNE
jgi:hypothetical protein